MTTKCLLSVINVKKATKEKDAHAFNWLHMVHTQHWLSPAVRQGWWWRTHKPWPFQWSWHSTLFGHGLSCHLSPRSHSPAAQLHIQRHKQTSAMWIRWKMLPPVYQPPNMVHQSAQRHCVHVHCMHACVHTHIYQNLLNSIRGSVFKHQQLSFKQSSNLPAQRATLPPGDSIGTT